MLSPSKQRKDPPAHHLRFGERETKLTQIKKRGEIKCPTEFGRFASPHRIRIVFPLAYSHVLCHEMIAAVAIGI